MENKKQGVRKKARAAFKSLSGRAKSGKSNEASASLSSVPDVAVDHSQVLSEQATVSSEQAAGPSSVKTPPRSRSGSALEVASSGSPGNANEGAGQLADSSSLTPLPGQRTSRYIFELNEAINEFKTNYVQFSKANSEYILIDDELENVIPDIATVGNVKQIAKIFEHNVTKTIRIKERKRLFRESHWPTQVGHFLTKLYPIAQLSCSLMGAGADVVPCVITINM